LELLGVPRDRLLVMRQGIEGDEFLSEPVPRAGSDARLRLLYLGQISRHKGADLAVEAVGQARAARLPVQLGLHGPITDEMRYFSQLKARVASINETYGESIQIGSPLERSQLAPTLGNADALLVPSRWYDNSPNVILEAFTMGVPVIAAGHGGIAEMVRDGVDGLLFQPGDARSLAGAIRALALDPALLAQLRAGVRPPYGLDTEMAAEEAALDRICPLPVTSANASVLSADGAVRRVALAEPVE
jgi:glycosyltransferase involved in cell wall biosynthesis